MGIQTEEEKVAQGREAAAILNNPIFRDAIIAMKQRIVDKWAECPARDKDGREWLWMHYQVAMSFENTLTEVMNTGRVAENAFKQKKEPRFMGAFDDFINRVKQ